MALSAPLNDSGWKCAVCNTNENKPIILVPIFGGEKGHIDKIYQIHYDCADKVAERFICNDNIPHKYTQEITVSYLKEFGKQLKREDNE